MRQPDEITITIPGHPPKTLSANARAFWAVKSRDKQAWQSAVVWAVKQAIRWDMLEKWKPYEYAEIFIENVVADGRRRDTENWLYLHKATIDALRPHTQYVRRKNGRTYISGNLQGVGLIQDDDSKSVKISLDFTVDKARAPMVIITIKRKEGI